MRVRFLKPGFFDNELLAQCDPLARILFEGLWCYADRDGLFEWRPVRIKTHILPYDNCDINLLLCQLCCRDFILKYYINGKDYGKIPTFALHQNPHPHEAKSQLPRPNQNREQFQCHCTPLQCHDLSSKCNADYGLRITDYGSTPPTPLQEGGTCNDTENDNHDNEKASRRRLETQQADAAISHLNAKCSRDFKFTERNRGFAIARFHEGLTLDDLKAVVDYKCKDDYFCQNRQLLRPETLFGPKCESYLQAAREPPILTIQDRFGKTTARNIEVGKRWLSKKDEEKNKPP